MTTLFVNGRGLATIDGFAVFRSAFATTGYFTVP